MILDERKLSKVYRRMITADRVKARWLYEKLDHNMKKEVRKKCKQNGSPNALELLENLK